MHDARQGSGGENRGTGGRYDSRTPADGEEGKSLNHRAQWQEAVHHIIRLHDNHHTLHLTDDASGNDACDPNWADWTLILGMSRALVSVGPGCVGSDECRSSRLSDSIWFQIPCCTVNLSCCWRIVLRLLIVRARPSS